MQKSALKKEHFDKLSEYDIFPDHAFCQYFQAGETILREGAFMEQLLIVMDGTAKVCATASNGRDLVLCYYLSDGLVGDIELMTDDHEATTTIIAITDFECIALPYRIYGADLKSNITFLNKTGRELSLKLLRSSKSFLSTALHSGEERLCTYILQTSHNGIFSETLTDVARLIGISYRHLFRILNQLCEQGILVKFSTGYRIINRRELERIAPL